MASSAQPVKQAQKVPRSRLDMVENQFAELSIASNLGVLTPAVYVKMEDRGNLYQLRAAFPSALFRRPAGSRRWHGNAGFIGQFDRRIRQRFRWRNALPGDQSRYRR